MTTISHLNILEQPSSAVGPTNSAVVFDRDRFLLHQKHFSIDQKYHVFDEQAQPILYVKRRSHVFRNVLALSAAIVTAIVVGGASIALALLLPSDTSQIIGALVGVLIGAAAAIFVALLLVPKRHIEFCADPKYCEQVLTVLQDKKVAFINATYTAADAQLNLVGWFRKNYLYNMIRRRWYVYGPEGELLCICMEDSILLAILRRVFRIVADLPLMRTNYILLGPDGQTKIGEFNRKFTLLDKYVLDLTADSSRRFDRRLAVALGVLLDTGERREGA